MTRREFGSLLVGCSCSLAFPATRQRPLCVCGLLQELQRVSGNPFVAEPGTGVPAPVVPPALVVSNPYCVSCGGYERMMFTEAAEICGCGFCEMASRLAPSLVTFNDNESGQFHLHCRTYRNNVIWIYFCPCCGGLEPRAKRLANDDTMSGLHYDFEESP